MSFVFLLLYLPKEINWLSVLMFYVNRCSVPAWLSCMCVCSCVFVFLRDMCSVSPVVEPASRTMAVACLSLGRNPRSLGTGLGSCGQARWSLRMGLQEAVAALASLKRYQGCFHTQCKSVMCKSKYMTGKEMPKGFTLEFDRESELLSDS